MQRFLRGLSQQAWAIEPAFADRALGVLEARLYGDRPDAEELEARLSRQRGQPDGGVADRDGAVSVIPVRGVISQRASMIEDISPGAGTSAERIESQMRDAYASRDVKAIVLDIDSPGGAAAGTPEAADVIRSYRGGEKPIIAQVHGLAASAAYWIASAADEIVATPSSQIGSIGVITVHESIARMLEDEGRDKTIISAGAYKAEATPYAPLTDDARAHMQDTVNRYYQLFLSGVSEGRGVSVEYVEANYGQGRTYIADEAMRAGMIDRIDTMRNTLIRLGADVDSAGPAAQSPERRGTRSVSLERKRLAKARA